ncbi:microcystin-dependent protein [Oxalobacteraceae bacterium GrIS 1.11]
MDMFIGTILPVGFSFAPRGWMSCNGQLMNVQQNAALFSLIGNKYGGDGINNFALPDLRGRMPLGNNGAGVAGRIVADLGSVGGAASATVTGTGTGTAAVTLTTPNLPAHNHNATFTENSGAAAPVITVNVSRDVGTTSVPAAGNFLAAGKSTGAQPLLYRPDAGVGTVALATPTATLSGAGGTVAVANTGSGTTLQAPVTVSINAAVNTAPPYQGVQYIICVEGLFPTRN